MEKEKDNVLSDKKIEIITEFVKSIRFGSVSLIIQDGKIIQIEKHEKIRLS